MTMHFGAYPAFRAVRAAAAKPNQVNRAAGAALEVQHLRSQVDRLYMITEALWTLLKRQGNYTEEQLEALVEEIDLRDGKMAWVPQKCSQCSRPVSARTGSCIYCGARADSAKVF